MAEIKTDAVAAGGTPTGGSATPPPAPVEKPSSEAYDFQKVYDGLDPKFRDEFTQRVWNFTNAQLQEQFGDVMPAFVEIANDPELRKEFAKLSDKERRQFLLLNGGKVYDDTHSAPDPSADQPMTRAQAEKYWADRQREVDDKAAVAQREAQYHNARVADKDALLTEFPDLKWKDASDPNYARVAKLIETAHSLSVTRNRFVSCKEVLDEQRLGQAPPPAAPATSRSDVGVERPQAPTTAAEGTANMTKKLQNMGGITRGAQRLARR